MFLQHQVYGIVFFYLEKMQTILHNWEVDIEMSFNSLILAIIIPSIRRKCVR